MWLIALLVVLALFFGGFATDLLFFVAAVALVVWLLGFASHAADRRWYRW